MASRVPPDDKLPPIQDDNPKPGPYHWSVYHAISKIPENSRTPRQSAWLYEFDQKVRGIRRGESLEQEIPTINLPPLPPARPTPPTPPVPPSRPTPPSHAGADDGGSTFSRSASTGRGKRQKITREIIEEEDDTHASTHESNPPPTHALPPMPPPPSHAPPLPPPTRYQASEDDEEMGDDEGTDDEEETGEDGDGGGDEPMGPYAESVGNYRGLPEATSQVLPPDGAMPLPRKIKGVDPVVTSLLEQHAHMQRQVTFMGSEVRMMAKASAEESRRAAQVAVAASEKYAKMAAEQAEVSMRMAQQLSETLQANMINNINLANRMAEVSINQTEGMITSAMRVIESLDKRVASSEKAHLDGMATLGRAMAREATANAIIASEGNYQPEPEADTGSGEPETEASAMDKLMTGVVKTGFEKGIANAVGAGIDKAIEIALPKIMSMVGGSKGDSTPSS